MARRLAERGVRFIQLYHRDWDHHGGLPKGLPKLCKETDQPTAALIADLKQRGMLDDTLVVWGGEFGRTVYCQGRLTPTDYGRDHHPRCFTVWMAGGGIKPGITLGATDDYGYNITERPVHVHDLQATILHCTGRGPSAAHLQISGPPLPPDGRRGQSGQRNSGITYSGTHSLTLGALIGAATVRKRLLLNIRAYLRNRVLN